MSTKGHRFLTVVVCLVLIAVIALFVFVAKQVKSLKIVTEQVQELNSDIEESSAQLNQIGQKADQIEQKTEDLNESVDKISPESISSALQETRGTMASLTVQIKDYSDVLNKTYSEMVSSTEVAKADAVKFSELAETSDEDLKAVFYMAAIYHDSTNPEYYRKYLDYIDSASSIDPSEYATVGALLENAILISTYDESLPLIELYEEVLARYSDTMTVEEEYPSEEELRAAWDNAVLDFNGYASSPELTYEGFMDVYDAAYAAYSDLLVQEPSDDEMFSVISNVYQIVELVKTVQAQIDTLKGMSNEEFSELYPLVSQILDSSLLAFGSRDSSLDGAYGEVIVKIEDYLIASVDEMDNRYDDILLENIEKQVTSLPKSSTSSFNAKKAQEDYSSAVLNLSLVTGQLRNADSHADRINKLQSSLEEASRAIYVKNYTNYQIWAKGRLVSLKNLVDDAKKNNKLSVLVRNGYFNIDESLLISQLLTAYQSLWKDDYIEDSTISFETLLRQNPVNKVQLGEV